MIPEDENLRVMAATIKTITDILTKRMNNRITALTALESNSLESVPDKVKELREIQASRTRAVIEEQSDIIEIIKAMFPDA